MVWQICFHYWWAAIPNQKEKSQHSRLWNEGKFHHFRSVVTNGKVNAFSVSCLDHETMTLQSSALGNCMLRDSFAEQCSPVLFCLFVFILKVKFWPHCRWCDLKQRCQTLFLFWVAQNSTEKSFLSQPFSLIITLQHVVENEQLSILWIHPSTYFWH